MRIKQLPPNPNLDHLKRQAKDLLAALRETEPAATLASAQNMLAEEYTFRSWPELKSEVERRRSTPDPFESSVVSELADQFGLGAPHGDAAIVAHDFQGVRVRFATATGDWMAHQVFDWVDDTQVELTLPLVEAARELGVSTPVAVATAGGGWVATVASRSWRVARWMDAGPPLPKPAARSSVRRVGELIGALHALALHTDHAVNPWLTTRRPFSEWVEIHELANAMKAEWAPLLAQGLATIEELTHLAPDLPPGRLQLTSSLGGECLRSGPEGTLAVLGWDFAGANLPAAEFASSLSEWADDQHHVIDPRRVESYVAGYRFTAGGVPDLGLSIFSTAITAWMNQLASRMTASCWADAEDERRRATTEVLHMLAHPMSRLRFEQILTVL